MRKIALLLIAAMILTAVSCSTGISQSFTVLSTDGDGHFKDDITYTEYNWSTSYDDWEADGTPASFELKRVYNYGKDGSYSLNDFFFEGPGLDINGNGTLNEGYILARSWSGSYTYIDYILTIRELGGTSHIGWDDNILIGDDSDDFSYWENSLNSYTYSEAWIESSSRYMSANSSEWAYITQPDGTWKFHEEWGSEGDIPGMSDHIYTLTGDSLSFHRTSSWGYEEEWTLDILDTFPENEEFKAGSMISFNGFYSVARDRNSSSDPWINDNNYQEIGDEDLTHFGDFIIRTYGLYDFARTTK